LVVTATSKPGTVFLGHGMGRLAGPVTFQFRVRASAGGPGKIEWLPGGAGDPEGSQSTPFDVPGGDWQTLSVEVPARGPLGVVRLYLPASEGKPVEVDWIEVSGKGSTSNSQRWEFTSGNSP
jgi:hypothetical protein